MQLRIYFRQRKTFNLQGAEMYYAGNNPYSLQEQIGTLPVARQLPNYHQFLDVTDHSSDLHKLSFKWTEEKDNSGSIVPTGQQTKKATSGELTFEGEAYSYLRKWLVDDVSAANNQMEVQVEHVGCGYYTDWVIDSTDLEWCEDEVCTFNVSLKQQNESLKCIQNTLIADNWQGWFPLDGVPDLNKKHPRFSYCTEVRSDALLVVLWWIMGMTCVIFFVTFLVVAAIWNTIVAIFITILALFAIFSQKLRDRIDELEDSFITIGDLRAVFAGFYLESAGCGREQPAPLIRDYIYNVCAKCEITVNETTAPIFFAEYINIETSSDRFSGEGAKTRHNPHYNACYFAPIAKKGIRRFDDLSLTLGANLNTTHFWQPENNPLITLDEFLDQLAQLYNAEWRVEDNKLLFRRKDYWQDTGELFNFSAGHPDTDYLIRGLCYEWNGKKYPATIEGLYNPDAADVSGNASGSYYNRAVSVGDALKNPNFDGIVRKVSNFSTAKFRLDGSDDDYILNAFRQVTRASLINGMLWLPAMMKDLFENEFTEYADYALLLKQETAVQGKIIIWDGYSYTNAKAFRPHPAVPVNGGFIPEPNTPYNNYQGTKNWSQLYPPDTKINGKQIGAIGVYQINSPWAGTYRRTAWLVNYPMYFAPEFKGGMWDWFHWIDDPRFSGTINKTVTAKLELCCDVLDRIKPFGNGDKVITGKKIRLNSGYHGDGNITNIEINYDTEGEDGMYIELKANI